MTQGQLGQIFDVTDSQITNYEKGKSSPPIDVVLKMSLYFEIDLDSFFNKNLEESESEQNLDSKTELKSISRTTSEHPSITERLNFLEKKIIEIEKRIGK